MRSFVVAVADKLEVAPDMTAVFALGAASSCIIGKVRISPKTGWRVHPALYLCLVLGPGERKSPALDEVVAPLVRIEIARHEEWKKDLEATIDHNKQVPKKEWEPLPKEPRFLVGDSTAEAIAVAMPNAEYNRLAALSDEGTVFAHAAGMYSENPNLDVYLKGWDGSFLRVDRRSEGGSAFIPTPLMAMIQCAQPYMFQKLGQRPELRGKGLLPRFLFSVPWSNRGKRTHDGPPVDPQLTDRWNEMLTTLFHWKPSAGKVVQFDRLGWEELHAFEMWLEPQLAHGARLDGVADMADKIVGAAVRIAGVLWAAESSQEERDDPRAEISATTVRHAVEIAKYFLRHNEHALVNLLSVKPGSEKADLLWGWIQKRGKAEFTIDRDFRRLGPRALRDSKEDTTAAANLLVDRGILEPAGPGWIVVGSVAAE
jgi:hypothetical protein